MDNKKIIVEDIISRYLEITKVMYSAMQTGNIDVFEKLVHDRGEILEELNRLEENETLDNPELIKMIEEIKYYEVKINEESLSVKKDLTEKMAEKKKKHSTMKKANAVSNKYKFGGYDGARSSYIDRKK